MTEMPSKRRSGNRPSQDRTDTRDPLETIGRYICRHRWSRGNVLASLSKVWGFKHGWGRWTQVLNIKLFIWLDCQRALKTSHTDGDETSSRGEFIDNSHQAQTTEIYNKIISAPYGIATDHWKPVYLWVRFCGTFQWSWVCFQEEGGIP